jgi:hypothetical protein
MVRLITRVWSEFFIAALMSDQQLAKLCGLQPHHLIQLAERGPEAISYNKGRRMWRLSLCLRHVRGLM